MYHQSMIVGLQRPVGGALVAFFLAASGVAEARPVMRGTVSAGGALHPDGTMVSVGHPAAEAGSGNLQLSAGAMAVLRPRRRPVSAQWICGNGTWSTSECWGTLNSGDDYPGLGPVRYHVTLPDGSYAVTIDSGPLSVNSLTMPGAETTLDVAPGKALAIVDALTAHGSLISSGLLTTSPTAEVAIGGCGLTARNGGDIVLHAAGYAAGEDSAGQALMATGTGSLISLPNLASLAGPGTAGSVLTLEAAVNGRIDLPTLTNVTGNVKFYAHNDNAIATINCPRLERLSRGAEIFVQTGGRFVGAPLIDLSGVSITVHHPRSVLDTSQVTRMDDARVLADGGAVVTFPAVTSYTAGVLDCGNHALQAKNPGTVLSFPALTAIDSGACQSIRLGVYQSPGQPASGQLLLPALERMSGRVNLFAEGPDGLIELGMADLAADATLSVVNGAELRVLGSMSYAMTDPASFAWETGSTLHMAGGTGESCVTLEVAGLDSGNVPAGWTSNFQLQRLLIGPGARVQLVDNINNGHRGGAGGSAEALYVDTLEFADGAGRIALGGLHLYYKTRVGDAAQILPLGCSSGPAADFDRDGDVDGADVSWFQGCAAGPTIPLAPGCEQLDLDGDGDGDQTDFAVVQRCYSGAGKVAEPGCEE